MRFNSKAKGRALGTFAGALCSLAVGTALAQPQPGPQQSADDLRTVELNQLQRRLIELENHERQVSDNQQILQQQQATIIKQQAEIQRQQAEIERQQNDTIAHQAGLQQQIAEIIPQSCPKGMPPVITLDAGRAGWYTDRTSTFTQGATHARDQTRRNLELYRLQYDRAAEGEGRQETPRFHQLDCSLTALGRFYDTRGARQQGVMNTGTGTTVFGATASGLSAGAGGATQGAWLAVAFAPVLLGQFQGTEPTRDLYHPGDLALGFVVGRSRELHDELIYFNDQLKTAAKAEATQKAACDQLVVHSAMIMSRIPDDNKVRAAVTPEVERLTKACLTRRKSSSAMSAFNTHVRIASDQYLVEKGMIDSSLKLDTLLTHADRGLNYTPTQTVTSLLAAPFLFAGSVLAKEDLGKAVQSYKTISALESIVIVVPDLDFPDAPAPVPEVDLMAGSIKALSAGVTERCPVNDVNLDAVACLALMADEVVTTMAESRDAFNQAARSSVRIKRLSAGGEVTVTMSATSRLISVNFTPEGAAKAPVAVTAP